MPPTSAQILIGISGWRHAPWRGVFYPRGLAQRKELEFASRQLPTIEINGSFYRLQKPAYYAGWAAQTPEGFVFSVKGHRYITHLKRLKEVEVPLARFFGSGLLALGEKLGAILWQLPPSLTFDEARVQAFLKLLPADSHAAVRLARRHSALQAGGEPKGPKRPLRHAIEVRHASFVDEAFVRLLRRAKVAWVVADTAGKWPAVEEITAPFLYLRLHGDLELYSSGYSPEALQRWAARIGQWAAGRQPADARRVTALALPAAQRRDVYCYFDNDVKVKAPYDARALNALLGLGGPPQNAGIKTGIVRGQPTPLGPRAAGRAAKKAGPAQDHPLPSAPGT